VSYLPTYLPTYLPRLWFALGITVGVCFIFNHLAVLARSLRKQMGWPRANSYCLAQALMHACEPVSTQRSQLVRHSLNAISRRRCDSDIRHSINWTLVLPRLRRISFSFSLSEAFSNFFLWLFEKGWQVLNSKDLYQSYTWVAIYKANIILLGNYIKKKLMIYNICICTYVCMCMHVYVKINNTAYQKDLI